MKSFARAPSGAFLVSGRPAGTGLLAAGLLAAALLPSTAGAQAAPAEPAASAFEPDTVLAPAGGPRIVLLSSPGVGVAALRLAVPLRESAAEAGAGRLLRDLALERMRTLARPVGARVSAARTPWGLAYAVVGAAADFEYLAYLLREAVAPPDVDGPTFQEARLRLQGEAARAVETPARRVAADLRAQWAAGFPPLEGTPTSVLALDPARVRQVWARSHQAAGMSLVVSAPVVPEVVLAATRGMGAPEEGAAPAPEAPAAPRPRQAAPQTLRSWHGGAWSAGPPGDPRAALAAALVAEGLESLPAGVEATVELWELPDRAVLAVVAGAYSRNADAMRRAVSRALPAARDALTEDAVAAAAAGARRELMLESRTPEGLVAVVGRAMEADGDPRAAARGLEALLSVDAAAVRAFLDELVRVGPRSAEVRP